MPDWLTQSIADASTTVSWPTVLVRLVVALLLGVLVAAVYSRTRRAENVADAFPPTLVLLAVLIAMVTLVIGNNAARAFSLVGALSIVRFRTVVRDTKDTAFVIFAVAVGMAVGAGQTLVAVCGLMIVGSGAAIYSDPPSASAPPGDALVLVLRIGWSADLEARLMAVFAARNIGSKLQSANTTRNGVAVDLTYQLQLPGDVTPLQLVADLNRVEGVQSVDLRKPREEPA